MPGRSAVLGQAAVQQVGAQGEEVLQQEARRAQQVQGHQQGAEAELKAQLPVRKWAE